MINGSKKIKIGSNLASPGRIQSYSQMSVFEPGASILPNPGMNNYSKPKPKTYQKSDSNSQNSMIIDSPRAGFASSYNFNQLSNNTQNCLTNNNQKRIIPPVTIPKMKNIQQFYQYSNCYDVDEGYDLPQNKEQN